MQPLRGAEHRAAEAVGDHEVVADGDAVHGSLSGDHRVSRSDRVADGVSARRRPARGMRRPAGVVERALAGDERVERGIAQQRQRQRQPPRGGPARALRRARTWPTCDDLSVRRRAWNASPSGSGHAWSPYQLSSTTVASKPASAQRRVQARGGAAGVDHHVGLARRALPARRSATPSARAAVGPRRVDVHQLTSQPGMRPASHATRHPTAPAPTTATRSPGSDAASHTPLSAVSRLAASTARPAGTSSGTTCTALGRHHVARLVRVQAEHRAAPAARRPLLDTPHVGVAVLHRRREVARLKRRAHPLVFCRRHAAVEHQRLGAAADAAVAACAPPRRDGAPAAAAIRAGSRRGPARTTQNALRVDRSCGAHSIA